MTENITYLHARVVIIANSAVPSSVRTLFTLLFCVLDKAPGEMIYQKNLFDTEGPEQIIFNKT